VFTHEHFFHRKDANIAKNLIDKNIKDGLIKPVIPAKAGIQSVQNQ